MASRTHSHAPCLPGADVLVDHDLRTVDEVAKLGGDAVAFVAIGFDEGLDAGMGQGLARIGDLLGAAGVGAVERHE